MGEKVDLTVASEDLPGRVQKKTGVVKTVSSLLNKTSGVKMTVEFSGQGAKEG